MGLIDKTHRYSYTQLEQVDECPYSFYLQRISEDREALVGNSFADQGTLIHDLIDKWAKGQLTLEQLPEEYKRRYPQEVGSNWPRMLAAKGYAEKAFQTGLDYFLNFKGFPGYEIVSSEQKFVTRLCARKFVGVVDMILREKETGKMVILDHKSKSMTAFKRAGDDMYRQQLLYAKYFYDEYKKWPDVLMFNLFKEGGTLVSKPFDKKEYDEAVAWAKKQMAKIESFEMLDWLETKAGASEKPDFFCQEICSCRKICPQAARKGRMQHD